MPPAVELPIDKPMPAPSRLCCTVTLRLAGQNRDMVISHVDPVVLHQDIFGRVDIDPVRVGALVVATTGRHNGHVVNVYVFAVHGMEGPKGRVLESDPRDFHVRAVVELHQVGTTNVVGLAKVLKEGVPVPSPAIHNARTPHSYVDLVDGMHQRVASEFPPHVGATAVGGQRGPGGKLILVGNAVHGPLDGEDRVGRQVKGRRLEDIFGWWTRNNHLPSPRASASFDGRANGIKCGPKSSRVVRGIISNGTIVQDVRRDPGRR
eukprot:scaffold147223_cov60-Attheya_sp.AAC.5